MTRRFAALALAFTLLLAGCSAEDFDALLDAAGDAYDRYGRPSVSMQEGDLYYNYRHDFRHEAWAGEPWADIDGGVPEDWDVSVPVSETDAWGRPALSAALVDDAGTLFLADGSGVPDGWAQAEYPGICPGGLLYRQVALPGGGVVAGTAYLAEALGSVRDMAARWLAENPGGEISFRARAFYSGSGAVPEGILVQARDATGSFLACRYFWNVQPGIAVDYMTGRSWVEAAGDPEADAKSDAGPGQDAGRSSPATE